MWTVTVIGKADGRVVRSRGFLNREDAVGEFLGLKDATLAVMVFELGDAQGYIEGRALTVHLAWTDLGGPMGGLLIGGSSASGWVTGSTGVSGSAVVTR